MSIVRLYPKAPCEDLIATITAAGERATGIPEGTVLQWPSWRRLPQSFPGRTAPCDVEATRRLSFGQLVEASNRRMAGNTRRRQPWFVPW